MPTSTQANDDAYTVKAESAWSSQNLTYPPASRLKGNHLDTGRRTSPSIRNLIRYTLCPSGTPGDEAFAFGGEEQSLLYSISLHDLSAVHMKTTGATPPPRFGHAAAIYKKYLIVGGGYMPTGEKSDPRLYILDYEKRKWSVLRTSSGPELAGRYAHTMTVCGDKLILLGGWLRDKSHYPGDHWELDLRPLQSPNFQPRAWKLHWTKRDKPTAGPSPRSAHACASYEGKLYLYGGFSGKQFFNDLWVWDPSESAQSWQKVKGAGITPPEMSGHHAVVVQDSLYIHGIKDGMHITIIFGFSDLKWYKLDVTRREGRFSRLVSQQDPPRLTILTESSAGITAWVLDPSKITYPPIKIILSEDDARLKRVRLLGNSPTNTSGVSCDMFVGYYLPTRLKLAMKRPRGVLDQDTAFLNFRREAGFWSNFDHPNILPFLGTLIVDGYLHLVSPWIESGDLLGFVRRRSDYFRHDPLDLVTEHKPGIFSLYRTFDEFRTVSEIAAGIDYLHSENVVHGDLKGPNILISDSGSPLICDFGLTKAIDTFTSTDIKGHGSVRWQSPELFEGVSKTFKSDIYAFAMIIVEILTGDCPYNNVSTPSAIMMTVMRGTRPKPEPLECFGKDFGPLWGLAEKCWDADPKARPPMADVLRELAGNGSQRSKTCSYM